VTKLLFTSLKVNRRNCRIWESQNPHVVWQHERDTPELNVWCGLTSAGMIGPFFFLERNSDRCCVPRYVQNFALPQASDGFTWQILGAPSHYWTPLTESLNQHLAGRWVVRVGPIDSRIWRLLTFLWSYVKDFVYRTIFSGLPDLRHSITDAVASAAAKMLRNAWTECEHMLHACRVDITVHFMGLFVFRDKPIVCTLIKNKVIQFIFRLLRFRHSVFQVHCNKAVSYAITVSFPL
jgi:hypothetical protein